MIRTLLDGQCYGSAVSNWLESIFNLPTMCLYLPCLSYPLEAYHLDPKKYKVRKYTTNRRGASQGGAIYSFSGINSRRLEYPILQISSQATESSQFVWKARV